MVTKRNESILTDHLVETYYEDDIEEEIKIRLVCTDTGRDIKRDSLKQKVWLEEMMLKIGFRKSGDCCYKISAKIIARAFDVPVEKAAEVFDNFLHNERLYNQKNHDPVHGKKIH